MGDDGTTKTSPAENRAHIGTAPGHIRNGSGGKSDRLRGHSTTPHDAYRHQLLSFQSGAQ